MSRHRKRDARNVSSDFSSKRMKGDANLEVIDLTIDSDDEDITEILTNSRVLENNSGFGVASGSGPSDTNDVSSESDEALARRLAAEWDAEGLASDIPAASGYHAHSQNDDDEALARRLAAEWDQEPSAPVVANHDLATSSNVDSDEPLTAFRDLFTGTRRCKSCSKDVPSPRGHVVFSAEPNDSTPPQTLTLPLHAPCPSCNANHCRGCFKPIECPSNCNGLTTRAACVVHLCCAEVRAIALFELLSAFDRVYMAHSTESDRRVKGKAPVAGGARSVGPGGTGYGQGDGHPFYLGPQALHRLSAQSPVSIQAPSDTQWDKTTARVLELVKTFLPEPYAESAQTYDFLPHASVGQLLLMSQLPELLAGLLRNDSISDWTARSSTYYAMLALLRRMGDCELTIRVLLEPRRERSHSPGLQAWMWGEEDMGWTISQSGDVEMTAPLYDYFRKLTTQSKAFISGAASLAEDEDDMTDSIAEGASLCGDIIAANEAMERAIDMLGISVGGALSRDEPSSKGKGKGRDVADVLAKRYQHAWERLAFKHVELNMDSIPHHGHAMMPHSFNRLHAGHVGPQMEGTRNPKDRIFLIKEQAVMSTSLPPGIWVRVDEVRLDMIKIMIAGPECTPYADGLFEFDCFLPMNYPQVPPQMHLRTTGRGSVGFNPNLYANGKVCLSLLGTWDGSPEEQWQPYKSTLLQVLVSIQSMILIDLPYFNEPGRGPAKRTSASTAYNRDLTTHTTRWAIVDWLKDEHRNGIWADVISSHFMIRKDAIRKRIIAWGRDRPAIHAYNEVLHRHARHIPYDYLEVNEGAHTASTMGGLDLLKEFDHGLTIIEKWPRSE